MIIEITETLESMHCGKCGIVFAVPVPWLRARRESGEVFHCPNGDSRAFVKSEAEKLREDLQRVEAERDRQRERADRNFKSFEQANRRAASLKGALTRAKKGGA